MNLIEMAKLVDEGRLTANVEWIANVKLIISVELTECADLVEYGKLKAQIMRTHSGSVILLKRFYSNLCLV